MMFSNVKYSFGKIKNKKCQQIIILKVFRWKTFSSLFAQVLDINEKNCVQPFFDPMFPVSFHFYLCNKNVYSLFPSNFQQCT